jgi:hypothetical protein
MPSTTSMSYVGSQGHFLIADSSNARGFYSNQLDPQYLAYGTNLSHRCARARLLQEQPFLPPPGFNFQARATNS